jgi:hypothetical protein
MYSWLKDWPRIAIRYDRCSHTFKAAITIAGHRHMVDLMSPKSRIFLKHLKKGTFAPFFIPKAQISNIFFNDLTSH